jgi:hypothetical protein
LEIERMSIKDPSFMHSLKRGKGAGDTILFSIQDKARNFVGNAKVDAIYNQLLKDRDSAFLKLFTENGTRNKISIHPGNDTPFNGFSSFRIVYKGDIPKPLRRAHEEMHEINDGMLRRKYFKGA